MTLGHSRACLNAVASWRKTILRGHVADLPPGLAMEWWPPQKILASTREGSSSCPRQREPPCGPGPEFRPDWTSGLSGPSASVGRKILRLSLETLLPDPRHPPDKQVGTQQPVQTLAQGMQGPPWLPSVLG